MLHASIDIGGVLRTKRPGIGMVYRGEITIGQLAKALGDNTILYAPKYQRGFKNTEEDPSEYEGLFRIDDERLRIDEKRAATIAAKYLMAMVGEGDIVLYNPDVIWNIRDDEDGRVPTPEYDAAGKVLKVFSKITIPDSGHRHYAYWLLSRWKARPEKIPVRVQVEQDGASVEREELQAWIEQFDPWDEVESKVLVEIFNVPAEQEGHLFDEYNEEGKKPNKATAIDQHQKKTPTRRFIYRLMEKSKVLGPDEIQTRSNTISPASRKLTTNSTLDAAAKPFARKLVVLEKNEKENGSGEYQDLVDFFAAFFDEWGRHYPELQPGASAADRHDFRERSFALSNIMFFPLFKLAFELWAKYRKDGTDWRVEKEWKDGLARLAGDVEREVPDPITNEPVRMKMKLMARDHDQFGRGNPDWQGTILVQRFDSAGNPKGWNLSSTRQTRDAAFNYLLGQSGISIPRLTETEEAE
jgi:hypothetical protein